MKEQETMYDTATKRALNNQARLKSEYGIYEVIQFCYGEFDIVLAQFPHTERIREVTNVR